MNNQKLLSFFQMDATRKPCVAVFLSGRGTNAEKVLEKWWREADGCAYSLQTLVTDSPDASRARELGRIYGLPVIENDIRAFYRRHGVKRVTLRTEKGRELREAWTAELREQLKPYNLQFGLFAGFVPLTNLTRFLPCLNVHPGDLTYTKNGERYLVGLHTVPVERAILENLEYMRSSVILAEPYEAAGNNMDSGFILGLSPRVPIDLEGYTLEALRECVKYRPEKRPRNGYGDDLEHVAERNQKRLKENGDWVVLPRAMNDFAQGRFSRNAGGVLYFGTENSWQPIKTVIYHENQREVASLACFPDG